MAHTNATPNYSLPQFVGTDKPAWLTDFNGAMSAIDTAMKANEVSAATATASSAQNATAIAAQATAISTLQTKVGALETAEPINEAQIATNTQNIATNAQNIVQIDNTLGHTSIAGIGDGKVTGAIASLDGRVDALEDGGNVSVTADGVKTWATLLSELYALVDASKIKLNSKLTVGASGNESIYNLLMIRTSSLEFAATRISASLIEFDVISVASSSNYSLKVEGQTITYLNTNVPTVGTTIKIYY